MKTTELPDNKIPIEKIVVVHNPRKTFDPVKMQELADSIREHGVLQTLLIRPVNGHFELVAGERRWRAAKLAGLVEVPVIVKNLSDQEADDIRVIENLQREDLHPLEEADYYTHLLKTHKDVAGVAKAVGKTPGYVQRRILLCRLPKLATEAYRKNLINTTAAERIAALEDPKVREEFVKDLFQGCRGEEITTQAVINALERRVMLQLTNAPFDTKAPDLVPAAGACSACPKRSGKGNELFPELSKTVLCTDMGCFRKKCDAHWLNMKARAKVEGSKVLDKTQDWFWNSGELKHEPEQKWADLDREEYIGGKRRPIRSAVGKDVEAADIHLARDDRGRTHRLISREKLAELLKKAGLLKGNQTTGGNAEYRASMAKERLEHKIKKELHIRLLKAIVAAGDKRTPGKPNAAAIHALNVAVDHFRLEANISFCKAFGHFFKFTEEKKAVAQINEIVADPTHGKLLAAVLISHEYFHIGESTDKVVKDLGIDAKAIEKEIREQFKPKKKAASKKAAGQKK